MNLYLKDFREFDCESIEIHNAVYIEDSKTYRSTLSADSKQIIIKSSKLYIQNIIEKDNGKFELIFELGQDSNDFYQFLLKFDNSIKKNLVCNSNKIFGFPLSENNVNNLYENTLRLPIDIKRYPSFVTTVNSADELNIFNKSNDKLQFDSLQENNEVMILLSPSYIDFYKNKISLNILLHTVKIYNQIPQIDEYMFSDTELSKSDEIICSE